jgi:adenosine deaminase
MHTNYEVYCKSLPKVELHCHLGGSARLPSLIKQLTAKGHNDAEKLASRCFINGIDMNRTPSEQNEMFEIVSSAFSSWPAKKQLVLDSMEDFSQENVSYVELRTGLSDREKYDCVLQALDECTKRAIPLTCKLISSIHRDWSFQRAEQAVKLALEHRNRGVVALDLCGDPKKGVFKPFAPLFDYARREGLTWTCHFAESENESDLIDILNAKPARLGHCCYISKHPDIEERILRERIPIECCLSSNINTMRLHQGVSSHPVKNWIAKDQPFVLCTDNPGILCTSVTREYVMLGQSLHLSEEKLSELARQSIDFTFADSETKEKLKKQFDSWKAKHLSK